MKFYLTTPANLKVFVNLGNDNWDCAEQYTPKVDVPIIGQPLPPPLTRISFSSGKILIVRETPEEIAQKTNPTEPIEPKK